MKQQSFEKIHQKEWEIFNNILKELEKTSNRSWKKKCVDLSEFILYYRKLCLDLSLARERVYSGHLVEHLNNLAIRGHQQLYRRRENPYQKVVRFVIVGFPSLVRREWVFVTIAALLFFLPYIIMLYLTTKYPELVYTVFNYDQVINFEAMYSPNTNVIGNDRLSDSDFAMFGFYISNNIGIGFRTFVSGLALGAGSAFFLIYNGLTTGTLTGHLLALNYSDRFFSFVISHSSFEITAIAFSGAAGLKLGFALLSPKRFTRINALKIAAKESIKIMYGVIGMLVIAAFIEAYWSSIVSIESIFKYYVGALLWSFIFIYFIFSGRTNGYN